MAKKKNMVIRVILITPLIIMPPILVGLYFGFYLGSIMGNSGIVYAILFSIAGLLLSFILLARLIESMVRKEYSGP